MHFSKPDEGLTSVLEIGRRPDTALRGRTLDRPAYRLMERDEAFGNALAAPPKPFSSQAKPVSSQAIAR
jgi:hypothetical protein